MDHGRHHDDVDEDHDHDYNYENVSFSVVKTICVKRSHHDGIEIVLIDIDIRWIDIDIIKINMDIVSIGFDIGDKRELDLCNIALVTF